MRPDRGREYKGHGTWVVAVWRTGVTSAGKGELLGSIRTRWRG
ncbi:hypothetical protein [Amycolatopsis marina]|nr:hypothetical protein [Amycolatopsis marina]